MNQMSGSTISSEGLDARRRRLLFRAWHRGMREVDLITGRFADAHIARLSETEVDDFERLMDVPEPDLLAWVMGAAAPPPDHRHGAVPPDVRVPCGRGGVMAKTPAKSPAELLVPGRALTLVGRRRRRRGR